METFNSFLLCYSILAGFGIGLVWFLPIACGWSYFPQIRPLVAGSMFSWVAIGSIGWTALTIDTVNPDHEAPYLHYETAQGQMSYFDSDSAQVESLSELLTKFSLYSFCIMVCGLPFIRYNYREAVVKKNPAYEGLKKFMPIMT